MSPANRKAHGEVRQSQLLTTYGPGAMIDLPRYSVLVGGLDHWPTPERAIYEERLQARAAEILGVDEIGLFAPPTQEGAPDGAATSITVWQFPEWFVAQYERPIGQEMRGRARPLVHLSQLEKGRFRYEKQRRAVVPVRFVRACPRGHISDVNWRVFVTHTSERCQRQLWLEERGTSGDFDELVVACECGGERRLSSAYPTKDKAYPLGACGGERPWLGRHADERCMTDAGKPTPAKLLVRSASNAYFSQSLSVIHIPDTTAALKKAVDAVWLENLQFVEDEGDFEKERKRPKVSASLEGFSSEKVWAEIQRRKTGTAPPEKKLKQIELETLLDLPDQLSEDVPDGDFFARTYPLESVPSWLVSKLDRVVLVHRLREVRAQVGFTRFESIMPDVDGELDMADLNRASLSLEPKWLPAVENHGEGFFVSFHTAAIKEWFERAAVRERGKQFLRAFDTWKTNEKKQEAKFVGGPYVMLHSLSHLLITAISLECGYSASSIRERIYLGEQACGILLFTGSTDAEGTLGGIVEVGKKIVHHLSAALRMGALCSNDPVCAEHRPDDGAEERFLHGACCHGCLLIAEPSCEAQNRFLDRALVVPTVGEANAAFFDDFEA